VSEVDVHTPQLGRQTPPPQHVLVKHLNPGSHWDVDVHGSTSEQNALFQQKQLPSVLTEQKHPAGPGQGVSPQTPKLPQFVPHATPCGHGVGGTGLAPCAWTGLASDWRTGADHANAVPAPIL
jgi:hypothetical protein